MDSDKASMSDKDSDSTEISQSKQNSNVNGENSNDASETMDKSLVRKRGRRPRDSKDNSNA